MSVIRDSVASVVRRRRASYYDPVSRTTEILVGCCSALAGLILLGGGPWLLVRTLKHAPEGSMATILIIIEIAVIGLGVVFGLWAFRLLTGRARRSDGGLLSPVALTVVTLVFAGMAVLWLVLRPWNVTGTLSLCSMALAVYILARARRKHLRSRP